MSNTYALRQIGLMVGLVASVAIGAAIVLWLWMPGSDDYFSANNTNYAPRGLQDERTQLSAQIVFKEDVNRFIPIDNARDNREILTLSGAQLQYTQKLEASYTQRIERLLEPLLGADSIRAQVTADIDFTSREQTLESYKPDNRVLRNKEIEENVNEHEADDKSSVLNKHRREANSYEIDKTISHTRSAAGRIDKLSVTVIVDEKSSRGVKGNIIRTPHTEEELNKLASLVKKTIGFNAKRGDIVDVMGESFKKYQLSSRQLLNNSSGIPTWNQVWAKDLFNKTLGTLLVLLLIFTVIRPATRSLVSLPTDFIRSEGDNRINPDSRVIDDNDPGDYEKNMAVAARVVERDPKLVAQIMKNWVSTDGT